MSRIYAKFTVFVLTVTITFLLAACNSTPAAPPTTAPTAKPAATTAASVKTVNRPYDENANAQREIDAALALAKDDRRYVLLDFGGNWCPDCIVLAKHYETEPLKSFVEKNYHLVTVDIGEFNKNLDISRRYGDPIKKGVPAVVVLDTSGKMVGSTGDGALESARSMSVQQVMTILQKWTPPASKN